MFRISLQHIHAFDGFANLLLRFLLHTLRIPCIYILHISLRILRTKEGEVHILRILHISDATGSLTQSKSAPKLAGHDLMTTISRMKQCLQDLNISCTSKKDRNRRWYVFFVEQVAVSAAFNHFHVGILYYIIRKCYVYVPFEFDIGFHTFCEKQSLVLLCRV